MSNLTAVPVFSGTPQDLGGMVDDRAWTARPSYRHHPAQHVASEYDFVVIGSLGFAFRYGRFVAVHYVGIGAQV